MTHYTKDPKRVRVDFFRPTGKWYETIDIGWCSTPGSTWKEPAPIYEEFQRSLRRAMGNRMAGMTAVCLEPYHPNAHPLMCTNYQYQ